MAYVVFDDIRSTHIGLKRRIILLYTRELCVYTCDGKKKLCIPQYVFMLCELYRLYVGTQFSFFLANTYTYNHLVMVNFIRNLISI